LRSSGGGQCQHPHADQPRAGVQESALSAAEGQAGGGDQRRVSCCAAGGEGCLKTGGFVRFSRRAKETGGPRQPSPPLQEDHTEDERRFSGSEQESDRPHASSADWPGWGKLTELEI